MSKKHSPIWEYFKVAEDSRYVLCNLVYHLKNKHAEQYSEYKKLDDKQVDELPSKNQALCAFCVTCIVLLCVNLLYSLCKLNHC